MSELDQKGEVNKSKNESQYRNIKGDPKPNPQKKPEQNSKNRTPEVSTPKLFKGR